MDRRELLRELSRTQARWVNANTPASGDVNITAEAERRYLGQISEVFDKARRDRKRASAQAAMGALMLAFDPNQKRDSDGQWTDGAPGPRVARVSEGSMHVSVGRDGDGGPALRLDIGAFDGEDGEDSSAGSSVDLDAPATTGLAHRLADDVAVGTKRRAEIVENWQRLDDLEARFRQAHAAARSRRDPETLEYTPEDRAAIAAIQAELDPLYEWNNALEVDGVISEATFPGSGDHDLVYQLRGVDDGAGGWEVALAARPKDAGSDWDFPHPEEGDSVIMTPAEAAAFRKQVATAPSASMAFDPGQRRDDDGRWTDGGAPDVDIDPDEEDDSGEEDAFDNVRRFPSSYLRGYGHVVEEYDVGAGDLFVAKTDKGKFHVARGENDRQVLLELDDSKAESLADFVLLFSENQPAFDVTDPISGAKLRSLGDGGVRVEWPDGSGSDLDEDGALALQEGLRTLGPGFDDED